jgi:hypothetical protein
MNKSNVNALAIDLVRQMVRNHIDALTALQHPYFESLYVQSRDLVNYPATLFAVDQLLDSDAIKWETYQIIRELNGKQPIPKLFSSPIHLDKNDEYDFQQRVHSVTSSHYSEDEHDDVDDDDDQVSLTPNSGVVYRYDEKIPGGKHDDRIERIKHMETQTTPSIDYQGEIKSFVANIINNVQKAHGEEHKDKPGEEHKPVDNPLHNSHFKNMLAEMQKKNLVKANLVKIIRPISQGELVDVANNDQHVIQEPVQPVITHRAPEPTQQGDHKSQSFLAELNRKLGNSAAHIQPITPDEVKEEREETKIHNEMDSERRKMDMLMKEQKEQLAVVDEPAPIVQLPAQTTQPKMQTIQPEITHQVDGTPKKKKNKLSAAFSKFKLLFKKKKKSSPEKKKNKPKQKTTSPGAITDYNSV